jgi:hypothetical protein
MMGSKIRLRHISMTQWRRMITLHTVSKWGMRAKCTMRRNTPRPLRKAWNSALLLMM